MHVTKDYIATEAAELETRMSGVRTVGRQGTTKSRRGRQMTGGRMAATQSDGVTAEYSNSRMRHQVQQSDWLAG